MLLDRIPAYNNVNQWNCTVTNSREWYTWTRMGCLLLIQTHYNEPMEQPTSYLEWEGCWSFQSNQDLSTNNQEEEISHWCCLTCMTMWWDASSQRRIRTNSSRNIGTEQLICRTWEPPSQGDSYSECRYSTGHNNQSISQTAGSTVQYPRSNGAQEEPKKDLGTSSFHQKNIKEDKMVQLSFLLIEVLICKIDLKLTKFL